jgi:2-polyprenyl-3-methyl-5-hydroxy-6-metoxy-1,4-benzoquinol methylase
MPTSSPNNLTLVCREILRLQPNSVLDIGVGIGKWGVLVREYAEVYTKWHLYQNEWDVKLDGIEIHEKYRNPVWQVYNNISIGDAYQVLGTLGQYDLMLMIDVLEHFPKQRGIEMLRLMKKHSKHMIWSYHNSDQGEVRDNPHEHHLSKWTDHDFAALRPQKLAGGRKLEWGLFLV